MNIENFEDLKPHESKSLLYLILSRYQILNYNLKKLTQTEVENFFYGLKDLMDKEIIKINSDENMKDIIVIFFGAGMNMEVESWRKCDIDKFNEIVFEDNEFVMIELVNKVYIPAGIFTEKMKKYVDGKIDYSKFKNKKKTPVKDNTNSQLVQYFYDKLKEKVPIDISDKKFKLEVKNMNQLRKDFPKMQDKDIEDAIIWFLNHDWWYKIITDVGLLKKHMVKFLVNNRPNKDIVNKGVKLI